VRRLPAASRNRHHHARPQTAAKQLIELGETGRGGWSDRAQVGSSRPLHGRQGNGRPPDTLGNDRCCWSLGPGYQSPRPYAVSRLETHVSRKIPIWAGLHHAKPPEFVAIPRARELARKSQYPGPWHFGGPHQAAIAAASTARFSSTSRSSCPTRLHAQLSRALGGEHPLHWRPLNEKDAAQVVARLTTRLAEASAHLLGSRTPKNAASLPNRGPASAVRGRNFPTEVLSVLGLAKAPETRGSPLISGLKQRRMRAPWQRVTVAAVSDVKSFSEVGVGAISFTNGGARARARLCTPDDFLRHFNPPI